MKNFQCYFGEHERNTFNFKEGLNLVIGDNGGGKSKLYDAFYWVIYDQIFNSDIRMFQGTKSYKEKFISDKAKSECVVGNDLNVEVILIAKTSQDKKFKLTRIYKAKKVSDREWECNSSSRLLIDECKQTNWVSVEKSKHEGILKLVIPEHLKPYMWFQGEQVDGLMDFSDKSTLTNAINLLSNITMYDDLIDIVKKGNDTSAKNYRSAQNKLTKNISKSKLLNDQLNQIRANISSKSNDIEINEANLQISKDKIEELIGQIDDAEFKADLKKKHEIAKSNLKRSTDELTEKYNGLHKKLFNDSWVLKHSQSFFDKFSIKYNNYNDLHNKLLNSGNNREYELPIDVPQPIYVSKMLEDEKCLVCNRDAKKGTEEYEHIEYLLNRKNKNIEENIFINDCSSLFSKLYNNGLGFKQLISRIDTIIADEFEEIQRLRNSIKLNNSEISEIKNSFEQLIEDDNSENIVKSFRTHEANREKYESLLNADRKVFENLKIKAKEVEIALDKLVEGSVDKVIEKSDKVFKDLFEVVKSTRNEVYDTLIVELEKKANSLFTKMTERNLAIKGKIKLKKLANGNYIPEIVGSDGYILSNPNDSNIILVKLSLIMAIIISRGKWSENYSLILDAPTAKMAEKYTYGFYEALGSKFSQSIVMTYDFINVEQRNLLKSFNVGNVYTIESFFPNHDSTDNNDLEVLIKEVQL